MAKHECLAFTIKYTRFTCVGFPIRTSSDQSSFASSPKHFAGYHVLHRYIAPRHSLYALTCFLLWVSKLTQINHKKRKNNQESYLFIVWRDIVRLSEIVCIFINTKFRTKIFVFWLFNVTTPSHKLRCSHVSSFVKVHLTKRLKTKEFLFLGRPAIIYGLPAETLFS